MDIVQRLYALANHEHDDLSLGHEAAETISALMLEIERLTARTLELENELVAGVHTCGPTCRKTRACAERTRLQEENAELRNAIIACLVYWLGGDSPDDCPHTVAKIKALCDWDSQLDAARSAP